MRNLTKLDIFGIILVICLSGLAGFANGAEKCADGTECAAEKSQSTDQELEDSCSDEGESL
jgi:hypothetical protein